MDGSAPDTEPPAASGDRISAIPYAEQARQHQAERDGHAATSRRISRLRLATFLPGAALVVWALAGEATPLKLFAAAPLLLGFAGLVVWHARVDDRVAWHDALRVVNLWGVSRRDRDWPSLPPADPPAGIDVSGHPYAADLDVFGRASLFRLLGPAATVTGSLRLAEWLMQPSNHAEIVARQRAVAQLAAVDSWREHLAAYGILAAGARQPEIDRFLLWAEGPPVLGRRTTLVRVLVRFLTLSIWLLVLLHATGVVQVALWLIPVTIGIALSFGMTMAIERALGGAEGGQQALGRYAALFEHAVRAPTSSPLLTDLRERLSADGVPAPAAMRRLNRILGFGDLRRGAAIFHFPIQAMTLWDFHVLFALESWRQHAGRRVRGWLIALAELDALALLATARRDNPSWSVPRLHENPLFEAVQLGHPLLAEGKRVCNDVRVGPPGTLLLITGSNMSGKSTLLRAIGLNTVLAQAGGCTCASELRLPLCDLQTSIRVQDSLELGLSYFMAALARLKGVVDAAEHERPGRVLLYLLDEILQGTNSVERGLAVRAVARHLLDAGAVGAMTTHDLSLAEEPPLEKAAQLVHFTESLDSDGTMQFDYRLRPGIATSRNALRLMKLIGIEP